METKTFELNIGSVVMVNGREQEDLRPVQFTGELLGSRTEYGYDDRRGVPTDTRGVTTSLYRCEDGRLVVYIEDWSRWQGEPTTRGLRGIGEADLGVGGEFEALGREAGMGRPLTLEEALQEEATA